MSTCPVLRELDGVGDRGSTRTAARAPYRRRDRRAGLASNASDISRPFSSARGFHRRSWRRSMWWIEASVGTMSNLPASILERSSTSLSSAISVRPGSRVVSDEILLLLVSSVPSSTCAMPMMPLSGRADLVAHVGEEGGLRLRGGFGRLLSRFSSSRSRLRSSVMSTEDAGLPLARHLAEGGKNGFAVLGPRHVGLRRSGSTGTGRSAASCTSASVAFGMP